MSAASARPSSTAQHIQLGCSLAFFALFVLFGLGFAYRILAGNQPQKVVPLLVVSLFVVLGIGGGVRAIRQWRKGRDHEPGRVVGNDEPWRAWHDASTPVIQGGSRFGGALVAAGFAAVWLAATFGFTVALRSKPNAEAWVGILLGVFWLVGLLLVVLTVYSILHGVRWPRADLVMDEVPARLGGWLSGVIQAPAGTHGARLRVFASAVLQRGSSGSGSGSNSWMVWSDEAALDGARCERRGDHVLIPYCFRLPEDDALPESTLGQLFDSGSKVGARVRWTVQCSADMPGVAWSEIFHVPVGPRDPAAAPAPVRPPRAMPALTSQQLAQLVPANVEHGPDADSFIFPVRPLWLTQLIGSGLLAALCSVEVVLRMVPALGGNGRTSTHSLPLMGGWDAVSVIFTMMIMGGFFVLSAIGVMMDPRRIDVAPDAVRVRCGYLGLGFHKVIPRAEVAGIEVKRTQNQPPWLYQVDIVQRGGGSRTVSRALGSSEQAEGLAARLRAILRLPEPAPR